MFDNIGGKIKTLATVVCFLGIGASIIAASALWAQNDRYTPTIALGFGVLIGGCLASWIGSFFTYGFGELIEETTQNRVINYQILLRLDKEAGTERQSSAAVRDVPVAFANSTRMARVAPLRPNVTSGGWTCKKCGARNETGALQCRDCDAYK